MKELEKNDVKVSAKKLVDDKEYLKKFTDPLYERIVEKVINLYYDELEKDEYKNAPIRDLTISSKHLSKLENKIMSRLPKVDFN